VRRLACVCWQQPFVYIVMRLGRREATAAAQQAAACSTSGLGGCSSIGQHSTCLSRRLYSQCIACRLVFFFLLSVSSVHWLCRLCVAAASALDTLLRTVSWLVGNASGEDGCIAAWDSLPAAVLDIRTTPSIVLPFCCQRACDYHS
jgi:hypothetical protein